MVSDIRKHWKKIPVALLLCASNLSAQSYVPLYQENRMAVEPQIEIKAYPITLQQVRLLDGPFKNAMDADRNWLLSLSPDRFLHRFHQNAGFEPKAPIYEGWENTTQSGFCFGHYLSAMSMLYAATSDSQVKEKLDYSINELKRCQDAIGTGYVAGIPDGEKLWDDIAAGIIDAQNPNLNGIWVPWYNLHKLWAGLIDCYLYAGNETAKEIVVGLTDWACDKFKNLTDEQWQTMISCETGGMNDALYNTYALTGNPKHLELAGKFYHKAVLDPLSNRQDQLGGLHANTQVPKITGAARAYELTAAEKEHTIATFFWDAVRNDHTYCTGGNSNHEHFEEAGTLSLSSETTETCNTYNMLKLTRHLFAWNPKAEYMDYYERALYNHILSSQNPETGMVVYFHPLAYNSVKSFSTAETSFWCCVGTGFENHVKYAESIYSENENELYINLFIASELSWERQGMTITQETDFPESDNSRITIQTASPKELTFHIRFPEWAVDGFSVKINGESQQFTASPSSYVAIKRTWSNGDVIELEMKKSLHKELLLGDSHKTAFLNGPIVLAGETNPMDKTIVLLKSGENVSDWINPVDASKNLFQTVSGYPANMQLLPLYKKYDGYYAVYLDCYNEDEWEDVKDEYEKEEEEQQEIERLTLDYFRPNEQQQEIDHNFQGVNVAKGEGSFGKKWCDASNGGYFSFDMKINPDLPAKLILTYWGSDGGGRKFDIMVDDSLVFQEELVTELPNQYFDRTYFIPLHLTLGKEKVTVKLQAHPGNTAGGIFFARMILKKEMSDNDITIMDYMQPQEPYLSEHDFTSGGEQGVQSGYPWVAALGGQEFSFSMQVASDKPNFLLLSYWGSEFDVRNFGIYIDGERIASQKLYMDKPKELFDGLYEIPQSLTNGKEKITVKLKGDGDSKAGGIFYAITFAKDQTSALALPTQEACPFLISVSNSQIRLTPKGNKPLCGNLSLYSALGQALLENRTINGIHEYVIDKSLQKGVYLLLFKQNTTSVYSTKVVVS